jgi:hypothetical protein
MKGKLFSEQTNLSDIPINTYTNWLRNPGMSNEKEEADLYNEQNFYYKFVHPALYDENTENSIIHHYERKEPRQQEVSYIISVKNKTYTLSVDAINLNLYATGVGMLSFFLKNENISQKEAQDILTINQCGRRIFPPFFDDIDKKEETADYIQITGLNGDAGGFKEDFSTYKIHKKTWYPACFVRNLIADLSPDIEVIPVIDDRMFVNCWYASDEITGEFKNADKKRVDTFFAENDFWYKYVFVDVSKPTCQNDEMRLKLLSEQTYKRWQKEGMLYGVSRYSFVFLTTNNWFQKNILATYMRTVYSRMIELVLIQYASRLRFSDEVTRVSYLSKRKGIDKSIMEQIRSLYKEYIRFINQIHFREVSIQDQGIELYQLISQTLNIEKYVEKVDKEIAELHQYMDLLDDKIRNRNAEKLNLIATIFLPATLFTGLFGMNYISDFITENFWLQAAFAVSATGIMFGLLQLIYRRK